MEWDQLVIMKSAINPETLFPTEDYYWVFHVFKLFRYCEPLECFSIIIIPQNSTKTYQEFHGFQTISQSINYWKLFLNNSILFLLILWLGSISEIYVKHNVSQKYLVPYIFPSKSSYLSPSFTNQTSSPKSQRKLSGGSVRPDCRFDLISHYFFLPLLGNLTQT